MKFLFGFLATAEVNCQTLMDTPPDVLAMMIMDPTTHETYMAMPSADQVFNMETGEILESFMNPVEEEVEEEEDTDWQEVSTDDCWYNCGEQGGSCSWCGEQGYCCHKTEEDLNGDCPELSALEVITTTETHVCVEKIVEEEAEEEEEDTGGNWDDMEDWSARAKCAYATYWKAQESPDSNLPDMEPGILTSEKTNTVFETADQMCEEMIDDGCNCELSKAEGNWYSSDPKWQDVCWGIPDFMGGQLDGYDQEGKNCWGNLICGNVEFEDAYAGNCTSEDHDEEHECHEGPYTGVGNCVEEECARAQDELYESENFLEEIALKAECMAACDMEIPDDDEMPHPCGFLVNGVSFILFALLAILKI